jgi:hypothetical protein
MSTINSIVKNIEILKLKKLYEEYKTLFDIVSKFIIKKHLLLYGGLTINMMLPKKYKFYKDYTLNDYDCYSKNALNDAYDLAQIIKDKGYKYIKVKKAKHKDTFKIYVDKVQIVDITQLDKDIYDKLNQISKQQRPTLKHYNDRYNLLPISMVKRNLYFELSRPEQSAFRWEKLYNRYKIFSEIYTNNVSKIEYECVPIEADYRSVVKILLRYIKMNGYPIIDSYALKFYLKLKNTCCCRTNIGSKFLVILSNEYEKTKDEIVQLLNDNLDKNFFHVIVESKALYTDIMNPRYGIVIIDMRTNQTFRIITIIENKNQCFSIQKMNGYTIGSLDTILYFLYSYYLLNEMYGKNPNFATEYLHYINSYEDYIKKYIKNDIKKRLKPNCYGVIVDDDYKLEWKKRKTIKIL